MKFFMYMAIAALIVGGIYHEDVSEYFADLSSGSYGSGGGSSMVGSMRDMGNAGSNLLGGIGR